MPDAPKRTQRAIMACGQWLAECLRMGWSRDQLDALEALWWDHHDERGNLKAATPSDAAPEKQP